MAVVPIEPLPINESRFSKMEDAIEKLTGVASDLSKLLAVQEHRITQQEKSNDFILKLLEKRREDMDAHVDKIYNTIDERDAKILEEVKEMRSEANIQHRLVNDKITKLEKLIWLAIGSGAVIGYILDYGIQIFLKVNPLIMR